MATVHTAYGPGRIIAQETVRGRTQYKVAGDGFEVWLDEAKIASQLDDDYSERLAWAPLDSDNSTELPYDPSPQHSAIGQSGYDDGSSTIQPIHHIDADERLSPSNSVSFDEAEDDDEPGPSADLFAKQAKENFGLDHPMVQKGLGLLGLPSDKQEMLIGGAEGHAANKAVRELNRRTDQIMDALSPGNGWGELIKGGSRHEAILPALLPLLGLGAGEAGLGAAAAGAAARAGAGALVNKGVDAVSHFGDDGGVTDPESDGGGWGDLIKSGSYRPAGLSDRYIDITAGADYHNDPVAQFRHDPDAYINRIGQIMDEGLNPRFAEYMELVEGDTSIRTAAWKDVRKKAMRLKREGHVTVKDIAPNRIMASVVGDHDTYDVLILKSGGFGGLNEGMPGHTIANWHCGCEWGRWAFRRKFSYVGRLCSHAYASYLTMQSAAMKGKPRQPKLERGKRPSRNMYFPTTNMRHADNLQNGPQRLTPDMVVNDTDDAHMFWDVTKDERTDTGPDDVVSEKDIVHFARVMQACEVTEQPYPRQLVAFLARYASEKDDTQNDYEAPHIEDSKPALNKLRNFADEGQEGDFGAMAERVHEIQDAVEDARDNGVDASQFVAAVRKMAEEEGNGWQSPLKLDPTGAGFDMRNPFPSSTMAPNGGKFNTPTKTKNAPAAPAAPGAPKTQEPGITPAGPNDPRLKAYDNLPGVKGRDNSQHGPRGTVNNPDYNTKQRVDQGQVPYDNKSPGAGQGAQAPQANGAPAVAPSNGKGGGAGAGTGTGSGTGGSGTGGGMTTGPVADGGVAGAENGNNSAITKGGPNVDADGYYTVQKGDTLSDISQRAYGDMNKYQDIAKGNNISNPDVINEGQRIKLDNLNDVGNGGIGGDKTNPAGGGSDNNISTPEKVDTGAVNTPGNPAAPAANTPGDTSGTSGAGAGTVNTPDSSASGGNAAPAPAPAPLAAEQGGTQRPASRRRMATGESDSVDPNAAANGTKPSTNSTSTSTKPGVSTATTPAKPGSTTPASPTALPTQQPGGTDTQGAGTGTGAKKTPEVKPDKGSDTYDPNDPAQNQAPQSEPGNQGFANPSSGGFNVGDALGTGVGAVSDLASGFANAAPGLAQGIGQAVPGIAQGVGSAISGLASGLGGILGSKTASSSIFASREDYDEWVRYAYPTADGEGDLEPHTHPFAGSGYPGPLEIGTSEEYADKARKKHDDVTDLGDDELSTSMGDWQKQSSYEEATDDASDIVRAFQANLGETALGAGAGGGSGRFDDFSGAAQGFLRTAGRNYSLAEQSELIREGDKGGARNLASLDLRGTHYEDMETLGW